MGTTFCGGLIRIWSCILQNKVSGTAEIFTRFIPNKVYTEVCHPEYSKTIATCPGYHAGAVTFDLYNASFTASVF